MAQGWVDRVIFNAASGGTADFVVSAAVQGYNTPAQSNAVSGTLYHYAAQSSDLTQWEVGTGAYTSGTTTQARTTIEFSSNANAKVSFSSPPQVMLTVLAADFRENVTSDRTYYVNNVTGSDNNNGLTSGAAFRTIGKAVNVVCDSLYIVNANITIQLATTGVDYNEFVHLRPWVNQVGNNNASAGFTQTILILGDITDGSAVRIAPTGAVVASNCKLAVVEAIGSGANWQIDIPRSAARAALHHGRHARGP